MFEPITFDCKYNTWHNDVLHFLHSRILTPIFALNASKGALFGKKKYNKKAINIPKSSLID